MDLDWNQGELTKAIIRSKLGRPVTLRYKDHRRTVDLEAGKPCQLNSTMEISTGESK